MLVEVHAENSAPVAVPPSPTVRDLPAGVSDHDGDDALGFEGTKKVKVGMLSFVHFLGAFV